MADMKFPWTTQYMLVNGQWWAVREDGVVASFKGPGTPIEVQRIQRGDD